MKTYIPFVLSVICLFACGCNTPRGSRFTAQTIAYMATTVALEVRPDARPYMESATEVICRTANGTNATTPTFLFSELEQVPHKNPYGVMFFNTALIGWMYLYDSKSPDAQQSLLGTCDGLRMGLMMGGPAIRRLDRPHVTMP